MAERYISEDALLKAIEKKSRKTTCGHGDVDDAVWVCDLLNEIEPYFLTSVRDNEYSYKAINI